VKEKNSDLSFRLALRYQLRWLILTLQASSEKANRKALAADAQEIVDAIFRDADKLAGQEQELNQSVTATVFARAYDIGHLENDKWPLSPVHLGEVYGSIVFPPLRMPARVTELRAAWIKRIQQEGIKVEAWSDNSRANPKGNGRGKTAKDERKIGMSSEMKGLAYERFRIEILPELQWQMEMDLFRSGDESAAAMRMLSHLEKHLNHKSARSWGEQFKNLLNPKVVAAPPVPAEIPIE
jgi:hypothetical protein